MTTLMWFRRDLRTADNPALLQAISTAERDRDQRIVPVFVVDPRLWGPSSDVRRSYLAASLASLRESLGGTLLIRTGDPVDVIPQVAQEASASSVHITADFGRYGRERDRAVAHALGRVPLTRTGSAHLVAPGAVRKADGTPYRVFTPYYKAWLAHGWSAPAGEPPADTPWWAPGPDDGIPAVASPEVPLPAAGEAAAWERWAAFREGGAATYGDDRNRPDLDSTSRMSTPLKWGEVHPRSLVAELTDDDGPWLRQLAWRDFYGDVLFHNPTSVTESLDRRFDEQWPWASGPQAEAAFEAWEAGRTGYPFVDAGMRQLRTEGWMHNRVRMVVASFLVKDLHLPWQRGARTFMRWLTDADPANNAHGWQWTAGCGTDAAPFYRIFNPVFQGVKFDPDGAYVRRYVPELAHLPGAAAHEPWAHAGGYARGYPRPIVDHAAERAVALADLAAMKPS